MYTSVYICIWILQIVGSSFCFFFWTVNLWTLRKQSLGVCLASRCIWIQKFPQQLQDKGLEMAKKIPEENNEFQKTVPSYEVSGVISWKSVTFLFKAVDWLESSTARDKDTTLAWNFGKQGYVNVTWTHGCLVPVSPKSPNRNPQKNQTDLATKSDLQISNVRKFPAFMELVSIWM